MRILYTLCLIATCYLGTTQDITTGLLTHYPFDGNANNLVGTGFDGTVSGALLTNGFNGTANSAYALDGDDFITFGDVAVGSGSFSIAFWVKIPDGLSTENRIILGKRAACSEGSFFDIIYRNSANDGHEIVVSQRNNGGVAGPKASNLVAGEWIHVAYIKDNDSQQSTIYINGTARTPVSWGEVESFENNGSFGAGASACVGVDGTLRMVGDLDEVRVYDRVLTDADIGEFIPARLESRSPSGNVVAEDQVVTVNFTKTLDPASVNITNVTATSSNSVAIAVSLTTSNNSIQIDPTTTWPLNETVTISMTDLLSTGALNIEDTTLTYKILSSGIVGAYTFTGSANDDLGNLSATSVEGAQLTIDRASNPAAAYTFDGNDLMTIADDPALDFDTNIDLSVSLWFRAVQSSSVRVFFDKGDGASRYLGRLLSDGTIQWYIDHGTPLEVLATSSGTRWDDGLWHHVAFVLDRDGDQAIYVDGELDASRAITSTGTLTNSFALRLGRRTDVVDQYMRGELDDIFIFNRLLSAQEILDFANEDKPVFLELMAATPAANALAVTKEANIELHFDKVLNSAAEVSVFGSFSGKINGNTTISDSTLTFDPVTDFFEGERVKVIIGLDVTSSDDDNLSQPIYQSFTVASNTLEQPAKILADSTIDDFVNGNPSIAVADMDNDGDIDAVGTSGGEGKVTLYTNDGTGVFTQSNIATDASNSVDIRLNDMNNDGLVDVIVTYGGNIVWYENEGSRSFSVENVLASSLGDRFLNIADMDLDGDLDIVHNHYIHGGTSIGIIQGNGDGTFAANVNLTSNSGSFSQWMFGVALGDINGDALPDIVLGRFREDVRYLRNMGDGTFAGQVSLVDFTEAGTGNFPIGVPFSTAIGDLDGDGDNDLLIGSNNPQNITDTQWYFGWASNDGSGSFSAFQQIDDGVTDRAENSVALADLDGDGDLDALSFKKNGLSFYTNDGTGSFGDAILVTSTRMGLPDKRLNIPSVADVTGDGALDIIVAAGGKMRYFSNTDILSVVEVTPIDSANNVALDENIVVTFDKDIDPSSVTTSSVRLNYADNNANIARAMTVNGNVLTIDPTNSLLGGTSIRLRVESTLKATDGTGFDGVETFFTTFSSKISAHYPMNGGLLNPTDSIAVKFNAPVAAASLSTSSFAVVSKLRGLLDGTYTVADDSTALFTSFTPYLPNEQITVSILPSIEVAGAVLTEPGYLQLIGATPTLDNAITFNEVVLEQFSGVIAYNVEVLDADGDGDLDVMSTTNTLNFNENLGAGSFAPSGDTDYLANISQSVVSHDAIIETGDLNLDGVADVVITNATLSSYYYIDNGAFVEQSLGTDRNVFKEDIIVEDVDLDGLMEVVTTEFANSSSDGYLSIKNISSSGGNGGVIDRFSFDPLLAVALTDADMDLAPDLVIAASPATSWYNYQDLLQNQFSNATQNSVGLGASTARSYDFNGDGRLDILTERYNRSDVYFTYADGASGSTSLGITQLAKVGDIDADGDLDIVTVSDDFETISMLTNNGSGSFAETTIYNSEGSHMFYDIELQDMDGDGDLDIVVASRSEPLNTFNGEVSVFFNLGINNNQPPAIVNAIADQVLEEDAENGLTLDVSNVFNDVAGDPFTLSASSDTSAVTAVINGDSLEISVVTQHFFGSVNLSVTADDGNGITDDTFVLDVSPVNDAPVFDLSTSAITVDEDFTTTETITVTQNQPTNEVAPTYSLQAAAGKNSSSDLATIVIDPTSGEVSITAIADAFGSATYTVQADDGSPDDNIALQTFTLTVNAVNDVPVLVTPIPDVSFDEDNSQIVDISTAFSDIEDTNLIIGLNELIGTDLVSLSIDNGLIEVVPAADVFGTVQLEVTAEDGSGAVARDTFDIVINAVNDAPEFNTSGNITVSKDFTSTETVTVTASPTPFGEDDQTITYSINPTSVTFANVSIDAANGEVSVTAVVGEFGTQEFTITADDGQSDNNTATQAFTLAVVDKEVQVITLSGVSNKTFGDADFTISATINSGLSASFRVVSGGLAAGMAGSSTSGSSSQSFSITGAGPAVIEASNSGDDTYAPFMQLINIDIAKADQIISIEPIADQPVTATNVSVIASVNTGQPLTYAVTGPATVAGSEIALTGAEGTVEVTVSQVGDANYNAASARVSFDVVPQQSQSIVFTTLPSTVTYGASDITLAATATSQLPVLLSLLGETREPVAILIESVLSFKRVGSVTIEASQAGNDSYLAATPVQQTIEVTQAMLDIIADDTTITYGDDLPAYTYTVSGLVNGESEADANMSVSLGVQINSEVVSSVPAGSYTINVSVSAVGAQSNYSFSAVDGTLTIAKATQTITIVEIADKMSDDAPFDVSATVDSGLDLTYDVSGPATISGTTITLDGTAGDVTVTVSQAGDANHNAAAESITFNVGSPLGTGSALSDLVKIYPNPVMSFITIETDELVDLRIFGLNGQLIKAINQVNGRVDISALQTGTYLMEVSTETARTTLKIYKAN